MTTTLEHRFVDAIDHLDRPEADLVVSVLDQLERSPQRATTSARRSWSLRPSLAVAAAAVVAIIAVSAIAPAREAVANWLGIGATQVVEDETGPLPTEVAATALGEPADPLTTTAAAPPIAGLPASFEIYEDEARGTSYAWPSSAELPAIPGTDLGAVLSVRPTSSQITTKTGPVIEAVTIVFDGRDRAALWIDGPHLYLPPGAGEPLGAARVLVWEAEGTEYRLESNLSLEATLALLS